MATLNVREAVDQIQAGMSSLSALMADPSLVSFDEVAGEFERLEQALVVRGRVDAAFAWLAESADAGRLVGSTNVIDYLTAQLGISRKEAWSRLRTGTSLFSPPPPPPPPEPSETEEERRVREQEEAERAEKARKEREEALRKSKEASAEILRIIDQELADLSDAADPDRSRLYNLALSEARHRRPEDLRTWLRRQVTLANQKGATDLLAAYRRRFLTIGEPEADGSCTIRGRLPAAIAAALKAALAPGERPGANLEDEQLEDTRTRGQRRVDQLMTILGTQPSSLGHGMGSVLLSVTAEDIDNLSPTSEFTTNTGDRLNLMDILRLGAAKFDAMVLHDTDGQPLALGRGRRTASFSQRLALFAAQGVCGCPDCTTAAVHNDAHHVTAWDQGGPTDLINLTLVCPPHHAANDDSRTGAGGRGYLDRCPVTGRVGRRAGPGQPLRFNETQSASESAGARIRARQNPPSAQDDAA